MAGLKDELKHNFKGFFLRLNLSQFAYQSSIQIPIFQQKEEQVIRAAFADIGLRPATVRTGLSARKRLLIHWSVLQREQTRQVCRLTPARALVPRIDHFR